DRDGHLLDRHLLKAAPPVSPAAIASHRMTFRPTARTPSKWRPPGGIAARHPEPAENRAEQARERWHEGRYRNATMRVFMGSPRKVRARWDPTHYPIEDDVGERSLQRFIAELLRPLVERWLQSRAEHVFVGADQFIYYEQYSPKKCVSPDVYVLPGEPP